MPTPAPTVDRANQVSRRGEVTVNFRHGPEIFRFRTAAIEELENISGKGFAAVFKDEEQMGIASTLRLLRAGVLYRGENAPSVADLREWLDELPEPDDKRVLSGELDDYAGVITKCAAALSWGVPSGKAEAFKTTMGKHQAGLEKRRKTAEDEEAKAEAAKAEAQKQNPAGPVESTGTGSSETGSPSEETPNASGS